MADAKISQLPVATTPLAGTELVPVVQGGVTVQTTTDAILTGTVPSGTANGVLYLNGSKVVTSGSALTFDGANLRNTSGAFEGVDNMTLTALVSGTNATVLTLNSAGTIGITRFQINNSEQMRLTSTGLGIGTTSPAQKLTVQGGLTVTGSAALPAAAGSSILLSYESPISRLYFGDGTGYSFAFSKRTASVTTDLMTLTDQGNLGLGVTPSANDYTGALQLKWIGHSLTPRASDNLALTMNAYHSGGGWKYGNTDVASAYIQGGGAHVWNIAPSGTAGNAISFTQAMTLDASGNLGIGTTSPKSNAGYATLTLNNAVNGGVLQFTQADTTIGQLFFDGNGGTLRSVSNDPLVFGTNNTERMHLDASGNLGLGVTPSAWVGFKSIDMSSVSYSDLGNIRNAFWNGSAYIYRSTAAAAQYQLGSNGAHAWFTAPSGTAGDPISFTQAMTLDASGRLLIGQTTEKTQEVVRIASAGQASMLLDNTGKTNGAFVGVFNDAALFGVNRNPSTGVFYNTSNYAAEVVAVGSSSTSYIAFGTTDAANTSPTERMRLKSAGQLRFVPLAADPAGAEAGDVYYNSGTNKLRLYDGSTWVDLN